MNNYQFYLFCYGSNGPDQLATRLGISQQILWGAMKPLLLTGWRREFFATSQTWGCAVSTICKTNENDYVAGFTVLIKFNNLKYYIDNKEINFDALKKSEAYPKKYMLNSVQLSLYDIPIYAFMMNPEYKKDTIEVNESYVTAVAKTLYVDSLLKPCIKEGTEYIIKLANIKTRADIGLKLKYFLSSFKTNLLQMIENIIVAFNTIC